MTETLARALHVEFRIAEQYKRIYGIQQTDRGFRALVGGLQRISEEALPGVLYAILRPILENLASEIERSCRFALGRLNNATVSGIRLFGGGARLSGLGEALAARLGVPVALPEPGGALQVAGRAGTPHPALAPATFAALAACAGVALSGEEP
jgi:type IV pilus assembly protein PilM